MGNVITTKQRLRMAWNDYKEALISITILTVCFDIVELCSDKPSIAVLIGIPIFFFGGGFVAALEVTYSKYDRR
jgi:hypothetical protein